MKGSRFKQNPSKKKSELKRKKQTKKLNKMPTITSITLLTSLRLLKPLMLFLSIQTSTQNPSPNFYKMSGFYSIDLKSLNCGIVTSTLLVAARIVQHSGKPISINIDTPTIAANKQFITDTDGNKRYGYYQTGSNCYYHTDLSGKNINPFFMLVIRNNGAIQNQCQVVGVITNIGLQPCGSEDTDPLEIKPLALIADNSQTPTLGSFSKIYIDKNYSFGGLFPYTLLLKDFDVPDLDGRTVEMMLTHPISRTTLDLPISLYDYQAVKNINSYLNLNPFASEIKNKDVVKRVVYDDLPGYFLGVYSGVGDDASKFAQKSILVSRSRGYCVHVELYIEKPGQIGQGETHAVELMSKVFKQSSDETLSSVKEYVYQIGITRTATHLEFRVKRDGVDVPGLNIDKSYSGGTNFIYFSFTVGAGYLYFIDATTVRAKYNEILHVFEDGQPIQRSLNTYQETALLTSVVPYSLTPGKISENRLVKIEYKPHPGVTENKAGLRVYVLTRALGVYPPFLITDIDNSGTNFPKCFFPGIREDHCLAMALLSGPSQVTETKYKNGNAIMVEATSNDMVNSCRTIYNPDRCLSVKPGYIINVEVEQTTPLPWNGKMAVPEFEALEQEVKDSAYVFENNLGTKYLVSCPYSCGTCGKDLTCLTCKDGSNPIDGSCSLASCSSITHCKKEERMNHFSKFNGVKCDVGGKCAWCSSLSLQADKMSCQSGCPQGTGHRFKGVTSECLVCKSSAKCKKCDVYDSCDECNDASHKLLQSQYKDRLVPGNIALIGEKDCFSPTELQDYFYVNGASFEPCMTNCKRCTTNSDCQLCGSYSSPSKTFYLVQNAPSVSCLDASSCSITMDKHIVPGSSPPTCYQCSAGEVFIQGSNPPQCGQCNSGAFWKDSTNKLCKPCGQGCSACASDTSCQSCVDGNEYIRLDGSCGTGCDARQKTVEGPPKRCEACQANCQECTDGVGCTKCDDGYYKNESNNCVQCPTGCGTCFNRIQCLSCASTQHYLGTDKLTCSVNCKIGQFKDDLTKSCKPCLDSHCHSCSDNSGSCIICQKGYFNNAGSCSQCPSQCSECSSLTSCTRCQDPDLYLQPDSLTCGQSCSGATYEVAAPVKRCFNCPQNCLSCNPKGCLLCEPNFALEKHECKIAQLVDFKVVQFFDPKSPHTFNLKIVLEELENISQRTYQEFSKSIIQHEDKIKIEIPSISSGLSIAVSQVENNPNQYLLRVTPKNITSLSVGDRLLMRIQSFSRSLDPPRTGLPFLYTLIQKNIDLEVEVFKLKKIELNPRVKSLAEVGETTNQVSESLSLGLGVALTLMSHDPEGVFLKFNQFLTLLKKLKLIGMFFGSSLNEFIEIVCGGERTTQSGSSSTKRGSSQGGTSQRRTLEVSLNENDKIRISEESAGSNSKLDIYSEQIFLEGPFMIKNILYTVSWVAKLLSLTLLLGMDKADKIKPWKLKLLKHHRKIHFIVVMSASMSIFFTGSRILLHRRNTFWGAIVKAYCCLNLSLLTLDLLEICTISMNLQYERQEGENEEEVGEEDLSAKRGKHKTHGKEEEEVAQDQRMGQDRGEIGDKIKLGQEKVLQKSRNAVNQTPQPILKFKYSRQNRRADRMEKNSKGQRVEEVRDLGPKSLQEPSFQSQSTPKLIRCGENETGNRTLKLLINYQKTMNYNKRNMAVEEFARKFIKNKKKGYDSKLILLGNWINIVHLGMMQVSVVSLPNCPTVLILVLLSIELVMTTLRLFPYFRGYSCFKIIKVAHQLAQSFCLSGFYLICLIIRLQSPEKQDRPVNQNLQSWGMIFISLGIFFTYLFNLVEMGAIVIDLAKKKLTKNKSKKSEKNDLTKEKRGLIFYTDKKEDDVGSERPRKAAIEDQDSILQFFEDSHVSDSRDEFKRHRAPFDEPRDRQELHKRLNKQFDKGKKAKKLIIDQNISAEKTDRWIGLSHSQDVSDSSLESLNSVTANRNGGLASNLVKRPKTKFSQFLGGKQCRLRYY